VCPDTEDYKECAAYECPEAPAAGTSAMQTALPSAGMPSSPAPQVDGVALIAGSSPTALVADASPSALLPDASPSASLPKTPAPVSAPVESDVGLLYLGIAAPAEALSPSGLAEVRSQLARHLSQLDTRIGEANIALTVLAGSVVLRVALSGGSIDGKKLAKQLEADVLAGRLSSVVVGYALAELPSSPLPPPPRPSPVAQRQTRRRMLRASLQRNDLWHVDLLGTDYIAPDHLSVSVSIRYTIE
jgi:hypothetical protein